MQTGRLGTVEMLSQKHPDVEKLVLQHIEVNNGASLDPHQFAFRPNRPTVDAVSTAFHPVFAHLENKYSYIRMLFVGFSSEYNTISPMKLTLRT